MKFVMVLAVLLAGCAVGATDPTGDSADGGLVTVSGYKECTQEGQQCSTTAECCQGLANMLSGVAACVATVTTASTCMALCVEDADCCKDGYVCRTCVRVLNQPFGVCD